MKTALEIANEKRELARSKKEKTEFDFKGKEKHLQKMCESYLKVCGLRYLHVPDNMLAYLACKAPMWIKTIVSRSLRGVPDLMIFKADKCLLVELKNSKGKESQGQKSWRSGYNVQDVDVKLVRSFEAFKKLVDEFNN